MTGLDTRPPSSPRSRKKAIWITIAVVAVVGVAVGLALFQPWKIFTRNTVNEAAPVAAAVQNDAVTAPALSTPALSTPAQSAPAVSTPAPAAPGTTAAAQSAAAATTPAPIAPEAPAVEAPAPEQPHRLSQLAGVRDVRRRGARNVWHRNNSPTPGRLEVRSAGGIFDQ